MTNYNDK